MALYEKAGRFVLIYWSRPGKEFEVREGKTGTAGKRSGAFSFTDEAKAQEAYDARVAEIEGAGFALGGDAAPAAAPKKKPRKK
jgi:hypothetical protein